MKVCVIKKARHQLKIYIDSSNSLCIQDNKKTVEKIKNQMKTTFVVPKRAHLTTL